MDYDEIRGYISGYWEQIIRGFPREIGRDTLLPLPHPFLIPSSRDMFQEMYYWDSFFMAIGLVGTPHERLIVGIVENMAHLLEKFGVIPNASRAYFLSRSQPPLLTQLIRLAFDFKRRERDPDAVEFLGRMMRWAEVEHDSVWMGESQPHHRLVHEQDGLSRYFDANYLHALACCESGWDHSPRCNGRWLDHLPVDLNSILFLREKDFARADREHLHRPWRASLWDRRAERRAEMMNRLMWDDEEGFFFDVDLNHAMWEAEYGDDRPDVELPGGDGGVIRYRRNPVPSLAGFYPMWARLATDEQAGRMVRGWLPRFEEAGGLTTTLECDADGNPLPVANAQGERYQWMYPNGWAPLQWIVAKGLENYGYATEAANLRRKWCDTCATVFRMSGALWEKYNVVEVGAPPGGGVYDDAQVSAHPFGSVDGFGWSNGVFADFERRLNPDDSPPAVP